MVSARRISAACVSADSAPDFREMSKRARKTSPHSRNTAGSDVFPRQRQRRLLRETPHRVNAVRPRGLAAARAALDVAVAGLRPRRRNAQHHQIPGVRATPAPRARILRYRAGSRDVDGRRAARPSSASPCRRVQQMNRGEADRRRRIAADRFGKNVCERQRAAIACAPRGLLVVRHHPNVARRKKRARGASAVCSQHGFACRRYSAIAWACACGCAARSACRVLRRGSPRMHGSSFDAGFITDAPARDHSLLREFPAPRACARIRPDRGT